MLPQLVCRTLWTGDDLGRGMNSETVDLIYLDPPFTNKNARPSARKRRAVSKDSGP